ncbi:MAG: hypothetical protein IIV20_06900, partial [Bacteroidaceae bacterium]|nr:hypothetical protein [Bacteroidaceae bacterium]
CIVHSYTKYLHIGRKDTKNSLELGVKSKQKPSRVTFSRTTRPLCQMDASIWQTSHVKLPNFSRVNSKLLCSSFMSHLSRMAAMSNDIVLFALFALDYNSLSIVVETKKRGKYLIV